MENKILENLEKALAIRFDPEDAADLAVLFSAAMACETIAYEAITLDAAVKSEILLLAYDERALIPNSAAKGPAWQSRPLSCQPGESYFMPRVIRRLLADAGETGRFDSVGSMEKLWRETFPRYADAAVHLFSTLRQHARKTLVEAGLIAAVARTIPTTLDLHEVMDTAGLLGIVSPHSSSSTLQGLSWYQINPALFWEFGQDAAS